jgi:type IV pilus assembly protein PilM
VIGLDIGSKFIKICELEKTGEQYQIISAAISTNPASFTDKADDDSGLINKIKSILRNTYFATRHTASAVGGSHVIARNFTFPSLSRQELSGAVMLEAGQAIFSDLDSMYTDFQVLGPEGDGRIDVLFVGAPKDIVDRHMNIIQEAELNPSIIEIDNLALTNCFQTFHLNPKKDAVVLLNIGYANTNICIFDRGTLRFVRNVNFGGDNITQEIAKYFGISVLKAENIKKRPELWSDIGLNIKNVLRRSTPDLLEAVYRSIEYCRSRKKLINIDKIYLTGGSSFMKGIDVFLGETLGFQTEKWNPLSDIGNMEVNSASKEYGQFFAVALGLALRDKKNV